MLCFADIRDRLLYFNLLLPLAAHEPQWRLLFLGLFLLTLLLRIAALAVLAVNVWSRVALRRIGWSDLGLMQDLLVLFILVLLALFLPTKAGPDEIENKAYDYEKHHQPDA